MKKKILVTGSIAYDYLYKYPERFQKVLDPKSKNISVAFDISEKEIHFGGTSANIVYSGAQISRHFVLLGIVGRDFGEYEDHLVKKNVDTRHVIRREDKYTSQASITTDIDSQQITLWYAGAAAGSGKYELQFGLKIDELAPNAAIGIVSPNGKTYMKTAAKHFAANKIPYVFDPGQALPIFSGKELSALARGAIGLIMNDYEAGLMRRLVGIDLETLKKLSPFVIITKGENGAELCFDGKSYKVPPIENPKVVDPTGCGDAFRAGLLKTIRDETSNLNADLLFEACKKGTILAGQCLSKVGTQNH